MDRQKKRWIIIVFLATLIVAGSFYEFWQKNTAPEPMPDGSLPNASYSAGPVLVGDRISINTADKEELERLPGIGSVLAGRIVDYRRVNGPFHSISDLKKVSGIGEAKLNQIKDKTTL